MPVESGVKPRGVRPLGQWLGLGPPVPLREALVLTAAIARQVQAIHKGGRIHGAVQADEVSLDEDGRPILSEPRGPRRFGRGHSGPDSCPPDLMTTGPIALPLDMAAAAEVLRRAGCGISPQRIDLYQLGTLLYRLLSGASIARYMYSPKGKRGIPAAVRTILERALGYNATDRYEDCGPLIDALEAALGQLDALPVETRAEWETRRDSPAPFERLGPYRVRARIGRGGMGDVYLGFEERLDRQVAIKVLPAELARQEDFVRRFHAEAAAAAKVEHPNVVPIYYIGEDQGHHFFAMQYVDGESLAQRLRRRGRLSEEEVIDLAAQCLRGLEAAHAAGLIHRDIKPGNVLVERKTGRAMLADFGLSRRLGPGEPQTAPGILMGTVEYLSPEQARGGPADARSDLYAIGVLVYESLAGRLPFRAESPTGMLAQHAFESPLPLEQAAPHVSEPLRRIVARLMVKDPADRYQTCGEVLSELAALQTPHPETGPAEPEIATAAAASENRSETAPRRARRAWLATTVLGSLSLAVASVAAFWRRRPERAVPAEEPQDQAEVRDPSEPAESPPPAPPLPLHQWIGLLSQVEPVRDGVQGRWDRDGNSLRSGEDPWSRVMLPVCIAGGYDLKVEFTRDPPERDAAGKGGGGTGEGTVVVLLPVGMDYCALSLSEPSQVPGSNARVYGLSRVNGRCCGESGDGVNPTGKLSSALERGRRYSALVQVRIDGDDASIEASLDGRPLVHWLGKQHQLDLYQNWRLLEPLRPGIGSSTEPVAFHEVQLRVVSGTAWVPPPFGPEGPDRVVCPGADRAILLATRTARIHGRTLAEGSPGSLGTWTDPSDWISWEFFAEPGRFYDLELRYACHEGSYGSVCQATIAGPDGREQVVAQWTVEATGRYWDAFRTVKLGAWKADQSGPFTLALKPVSKPGQAVMAFQWLRLKPARNSTGPTP